MWAAIGNAIKVFAEKHLIPAIISFIVGTVIYILTPDDYWVLAKINVVWYFLLLFCIAFILVHLVAACYKKARESHEYKLAKRENDAVNKRNLLEDIWERVNRFSPEERKLLLQFIKNRNEPYIEKGEMLPVYSDYDLLGSNYVCMIESNGYDGNEKTYCKKYVLNEAIYELLKYSYEQYGRICHFKEVE